MSATAESLAVSRAWAMLKARINTAMGMGLTRWGGGSSLE